MIGIYKITCLKNKRVYVGQSIDVDLRRSFYQRIDCKGQPKLFNSLKKYGWSCHSFEVVTECDVDDLNKWERYYQDLYSACGKNGLNCKLTGYSDRSGSHSEETRLKMSEDRKGINRNTPERIALLIESNKSRVWKQDSIEKMKKSKTGVKLNLSPEQRQKLRDTWLGRKHTPETIAKMTGKVRSEQHRINNMNANKGKTSFSMSKIVLHEATGIYYTSAKEAATLNKITYTSLISKLNGRKENTSGYIYA